MDALLQAAAPIDFGQQVSSQEVSRLVEILEAKSWKSREEEVIAIAKKLPLNSRLPLFDKYKISGWIGLLNLYGVGSFFQGDPGTSLLVIGGVASGTAININAQRLSNNNQSGTIWIATGAVVTGAAIVYGLIRPWFFADEQNRSLRRLLFAGE